MRYFEGFTGIAGFSKGIEKAYGDSKPECVGFSEIGVTPSSILRYRYPDVKNYGDATRLVPTDVPDFDLFVGGFPCQAFSIAGKRKGFADTRGTLFFEIARILQAKRPGHFVLENVAGLLSHDNGQTFRTIVATLDALGYDLEWTTINSKYHGVPQNRDRIFIIGHPRNGCCREILSFGKGDQEFDGDRGQGTRVLGLGLDSNYHKGPDGKRTMIQQVPEVTVGTLRTHKDGEGFREMQSNVSPSLNARARQDGSGQPILAVPVLTPNRPEKRQNGRRFKSDGEASFTVTAQDQHGVFTGQRIRRLTPVECERLQGFDDDWTRWGTFLVKDTWVMKEIADTGRYQVCGNAVTVNVIKAITSRMLDKGCLQ